MGLQTSGPISIQDIAAEFDCDLNLKACAEAAGLPLTNISMDAFYGLSSVTNEYLLATLDNPNPNATTVSDEFGQAVAISGDKIVVGARIKYDDSGAYTESGKAYVFNTSGTLLATLDNPNVYDTPDGDNFGNAVAISGDKIVVGARGENESGDGDSSGKAYIFNTSGTLLKTLNNPNRYNTPDGDLFGLTVAISGDKIVVCAPYEDDSGGYTSGKAYVFNTSGTLLATLNNPNAYGTSMYDNFGQSVGISGDKIILGAGGEDESHASSSGKAYIFNTSGTLLKTLNNPNAYDTSANDQFGVSVAISGDKIVVGANGEDDAGGTTSGKAYIFNTSGTLLATLDNPNAYDTPLGDQFGYSVAISGDQIVVGAPYEGDARGSGSLNSGKAYVFNTSGTLLKIFNNPNAYGTSEYDRFGNAVAISGDKIVVGAYYEDDAGGAQSGKAYIF